MELLLPTPPPADHSDVTRKRTATLGEAIRARRIALGLSQQALSDQIGVNQSTIAKWEGGQKIAPKHLPVVAEMLEMTPGEVMSKFLGIPEESALKPALLEVMETQDELVDEVAALRQQLADTVAIVDSISVQLNPGASPEAPVRRRRRRRTTP